MPGTPILGIVRHEIGLHKIVKLRKLKMRMMSQPCSNCLFRAVTRQIHNIQITLANFPGLASVLAYDLRKLLLGKSGMRQHKYPPFCPGPAAAGSRRPAFRLPSRRARRDQSAKNSKYEWDGRTRRIDTPKCPAP